MIEINGVAHVVLSVGDWEKCRPFYDALMPFLGLQPVFAGDEQVYYIGGRTALMISRCAEAHRGARFEQGTVGLHHLCFRCRSRADIDAAHEFLVKLGARIVRPPQEGSWAPGYYSVLFEDPDGIRLELNHVPGKGVLAEGVSFAPSGDYR
jgi:catechol 2,3-dioxygenase-like lactoylglutathione lyase family enzyme